MKLHFLIRYKYSTFLLGMYRGMHFFWNESWWLIFHSESEIIEECGSVLSACLMRVTLPSTSFRRALSCQTTNSDLECIFHRIETMEVCFE